jgi:hypothetical protein
LEYLIFVPGLQFSPPRIALTRRNDPLLRPVIPELIERAIPAMPSQEYGVRRALRRASFPAWITADATTAASVPAMNHA